MSLSFLAAFALPLCLAPWATHRLYEQIVRYETEAIAVDNAGIVLGRAGRGVLETWSRTSSRLEAEESFHHGLHLCARAPGPQAAACQTADKAWEATWEARLRTLEARTFALWTAAPEAARAEAMRLGVNARLEGFFAFPPVTRQACPVCGGRFRIVFHEPSPVTWESPDFSQRSQVQWSKEEGRWNYLMEVRHESTGLTSL